MKRNIILLTLSLIKGGAENQLVKLAIHLKKSGSEVSIISIFPDNDFENVLAENRINTYLIPFKGKIGFIKLVNFTISI